MKSLCHILMILLVAGSLNSCAKNSDNRRGSAIDTDTEIQEVSEEEVDTQDLSSFGCDYMGQKQPGDVPLKFAPGIISTDVDESCFEISISGKEIVFTREGKIYLIKKDLNGVWGNPFPLSFSGGETSFSKDGKSIYFNSRDHFPGAKIAENVWVSRRQYDQWTKPAPFIEPIIDHIVHAPSVAGNGNIYASGLIRLKYFNGLYRQPEKLTPELNGHHPFISEDESFMIFDRRPKEEGNPADLFITFRKSDDTWTEPVDLGDNINSAAMETNAFVTPDGKYIFFTRKFDIYWARADFLERLKNQILD